VSTRDACSSHKKYECVPGHVSMLVFVSYDFFFCIIVDLVIVF
jgi:hypothetical protein